MKRLVHFVNSSSRALHVGLFLKDARLIIRIFDKPDETRIPVPSNQRVSVEATDELNSCIKDGKFRFCIDGQCGGLNIVLPKKAGPDGPVINFLEYHEGD